MKAINSRIGKINFLQRLRQGKASIYEIMPHKIELWKQYNDEPDKYINEKTGQVITNAEMEEKEKHKGNNILFVTIQQRNGHEPKG
jgi:hypothetical protein